MNKNDQPTNQDLLKAINGLQKGQNNLQAGQKNLKSSINQLKKEDTLILKTVNDYANIAATKDDLSKLESKMVTKSYLDNKLGKLRGDLIDIIRKEDNKLSTLTKTLKKRKVITIKDAKHIASLAPFPQANNN